MSDAPKSAVELAMERLRKKDAEQGVVPKVLTADQKTRIAEVRQACAALLAQEEILHRSRLLASVDPGERQKLEDEYRIDVQRLSHDRDRKIEAIRNGT
jgi:hypothetical protein